MTPPASIPAVLAERRRWVVWRLEHRDGQAKPTKVPYVASANWRKASSTDPGTWGDYATAIGSVASDHTLSGVGFVFAEGDGFWGLDLDGCCPEPFGALVPEAAALVRALDSYAEYSPSGTGVHVICRGQHPAGSRNRAPLSETVAAEAYDRGRYFTFTGLPVAGSPAECTDQQWAIDAMCRRPGLFSQPTRPIRRLAPVPASVLDRAMVESDEALLRRAFAAKNGSRVETLYRGGDAGYASASEADLALASHLLFWTKGDHGRADRLFRASGRMRDKWDGRRGEHTYGERTLATAAGGLA